ncbi:MAG TPA: hypothetical protein VL972_06775 [Solirubrobacteraceae bacterium]|nr:hypothetical protein [Solirubrobacteraceae bacterium]
MPHLSLKSPKYPALAVLLLALAALLLSACGSSGSSNTATTSASANASGTGAAGSGAPGGPGATRFTKVRECLKKEGITLPKFRPGGGPYGARGIVKPGTGPQLPKGMTRAQYEAAIKKCGGGAFGHRRFFGGGARLKNPAYKAALAKFAACMKQNGVALPAPNTSGTGPIFDTKGLDTTGATFKAAQVKCASDLRFARPAGAPGAAAPGAAGPPPAGASPTG